MTPFTELMQKIREEKRWPEWVEKMFPLIMIYYHPKKPRPRRHKIGVKFTGKYRQVGNVQRPILVNEYGPFKKASTINQNNYSYCTSLAMSPEHGNYQTQ